MPRTSALQALPAELIDEIAGYLDSRDCCSLRHTSVQLYIKTGYTFLKHCGHLEVDFHHARLAELLATSQNAGMARAVKTLTIVVLDDARQHEFTKSKKKRVSRRKVAGRASSFQTKVNETIRNAVTSSCCASGASGLLLAKVFRRLVNVSEVKIIGNYLDMSHVKFSGMTYTCKTKPDRHRAVPNILSAIKKSGLAPPRLTIAELKQQGGGGESSQGDPPEPSPRCSSRIPELDKAALSDVRELRLDFGARRPDKRCPKHHFTALRNSLLWAAPTLTLLELCSPHNGFVDNTVLLLLPSTTTATTTISAPPLFPALRTLRLADDQQVPGWPLIKLLEAHVPQLQELSLVDLGLLDDVLRWRDVLECIRSHMSPGLLQRFRFVRNRHSKLIPGFVETVSYANTRWGADGSGASGRVRAVDMAPFATERMRRTFDDVDEWVAVLKCDEDDGEAFDDVERGLGRGVRPAIDLLRQGYYETSGSVDFNLVRRFR